MILESIEILFAATKNQSLAGRSFAGILERLIMRDIAKICRYPSCVPLSFGSRGLLVLTIRSWRTVGRANRSSENVVAFDPEVEEYRSFIPGLAGCPETSISHSP